MATLTEELKNRRSIRKYTSKPISNELIHKVIEAATYAPSAHNAQPWRFIFITDSQKKKTLAEAMALAWLEDLRKVKASETSHQANLSSSIERFSLAPGLILVCLTMENMDTYPDRARQTTERDLAIQSVAAAIENLLIALHVEGLGACWYCAPSFCKDEVRKVLDIPERIEPQALITFGYAAETPKTHTRKVTNDILFINKWGEKAN